MAFILVYLLLLAGIRSKSLVQFVIVWQKLQNLNMKMLSRAGKEISLKAVAQVIPNYAMQVYLLPLDLCRKLETMMNSFWWGNRGNGGGVIHWMKWELLCKPKTYGGIGFKNVHEFNVAMLGKQIWKFLTNPESWLAEYLKLITFLALLLLKLVWVTIRVLCGCL